MNSQHMYLFIRRDLSVAQQIIQMSHAVYAVGCRWASERSHSPNFVLIGVSNESELHKIEDWLGSYNIPNAKFYEPDVSEHTAICTIPLTVDERKIFKKFNTYRSLT